MLLIISHDGCTFLLLLFFLSIPIYSVQGLSSFVSYIYFEHAFMGAGSSVKVVAGEAMNWFDNYFDSKTYQTDFDLMDKNHDGGITFEELLRFINEKAKVDPNWKVFVGSRQALSIAHQNAASYSQESSRIADKGVVDYTEFKALLIHLFATSILWMHFKNADETGPESQIREQLTFEQFSMAVATLCKTHGGVIPSREELIDAFHTIDANESGTIGFMEVCNFCGHFINSSFDLNMREARPAEIVSEAATSAKNSVMLGAMKDILEHEQTKTRRATVNILSKKANGVAEQLDVLKEHQHEEHELFFRDSSKGTEGIAAVARTNQQEPSADDSTPVASTAQEELFFDDATFQPLPPPEEAHISPRLES